MKVLFYFGHPSQYLFLRETIKNLNLHGFQTIILIKSKDVLENLLINDLMPYINILPNKRGKSFFSILVSYLYRIIKIIPILKKDKPDLLIGTDATLAQLGRLFKIRQITIIEDDYKVIKSLAAIAYPFSQSILCPDVCQVGRWKHKKIGYKGYMKLGYLHPNVFNKDPMFLQKYEISKNFVIIRLSNLSAYHDFSKKGLSRIILNNLINQIEVFGYQVFISSEDEIANELKQYAIQIKPNEMTQLLAHSTVLIADSQSMCVEAAMLGIPSLRYSSFVGKISVLEELEHKYDLTFGIEIGEEKYLFRKLDELLKLNDVSEVFQLKRQKMLLEKIDVTAFMVWFIENYPDSFNLLKRNPNYQSKFIGIKND